MSSLLIFCSSDTQTFTEFDVLGFDFVSSNIPVNPEDPNSVAAASYTGRLSPLYPPFILAGQYNSTSSNIVFGQEFNLPFGGLQLAYSVDVRLDLLQIVQRLFHGELAEPVHIDVTGVYNVIDCLINLTGSVYVPAEQVAVDADVILQLCDDCSRICSAQAVSLSIDLSQPWNISLHGNYMLSNNITNVQLGGAVSIQGYGIEVFTAVQSSSSGVTLTNLLLRMQLPDPINVTIEGYYSRQMEVANLNGQLNLQQIMLSLNLTADIGNSTLSEVIFSGRLTTPFVIMLYGSYSLTPKSPFLTMGGLLRIDNLLDLTLMARADLDTKVLSNFMFRGMLNIRPLHIAVTASYEDTLPSSNLHLSGSISIQNHTHAIMVVATLNVSSDPVSIQEIALSGMFPPPFDFVNFTGIYSHLCSCTFLHGFINRDSYNLTLSTNLTFQESTEITSLQVQVNFHRPLNLILIGQYSYNSNTSMGLIDVHGMFNIPQIINFGTELELILQGMDPILSRLSFNGTFPSPLSLQVTGDYNRSTNDIALMGDLRYSFAELLATSRYRFMDDVHNTSAMLVDLQLVGRLTNPFLLEVEGIYMFSSEMFTLSSSFEFGRYIDMSAEVHVNTSTMPVSIAFISFVGTFNTPIQFDGEFRGIFETTTNKAELISSLSIGPIQFMASADLLVQNNMFSISSVEIYGTISPSSSFSLRGRCLHPQQPNPIIPAWKHIN